MGETQKKFHITDEGVIYKVDDTGEVTRLGNIETLYDTTQKNTRQYSIEKHSAEAKIRYRLSEMEEMLCEGKGKGLNRYERKLLATESSNISALEYFVEFSGNQWVNIIIARFERGETMLEPVLEKASRNQFSSVYRLASCRRPYSTSTIYTNLYNLNIPRVRDELKANPGSPYYEAGFVN